MKPKALTNSELKEMQDTLQDLGRSLSRVDIDGYPAICNQGEAFNLGCQVATAYMTKGPEAAERMFCADQGASRVYAKHLVNLKLEMIASTDYGDDLPREVVDQRIRTIEEAGYKPDLRYAAEKRKELLQQLIGYRDLGEYGGEAAGIARQLAVLDDLLSPAKE